MCDFASYLISPSFGSSIYLNLFDKNNNSHHKDLLGDINETIPVKLVTFVRYITGVPQMFLYQPPPQLYIYPTRKYNCQEPAFDMIEHYSFHSPKTKRKQDSKL